VDVTEIKSKDDIISVLDAGASKVFATPKQLEALQTYGERAIPVLSSQYQAPSSTAYANGVLFNTGSDESATRSALERLSASKISPIFLTTSSTNIESLVKIAADFSAVPIIPATQLTVEKASNGQISIPDLIGTNWTSDRADKLVPTVVTDERGIALGLVYSSQDSLTESLKTGTGVYQSRKRGLWYKGATSGDTQELVRISLDCDQDCLKFVVRQNGHGTFFNCNNFIKYTNAIQDSAIYLNPHVLATIRGSLSWRKLWFRERLLRLRVHTQRACSPMRSCYGRK
jgi:phosphoribosyl-ATP pyrophosphohydrolase/phosphoribosyl-AMP cyclohydrolase/histidinol dehydrogenase